jgi:hypothetical protein
MIYILWGEHIVPTIKSNCLKAHMRNENVKGLFAKKED